MNRLLTQLVITFNQPDSRGHGGGYRKYGHRSLLIDPDPRLTGELLLAGLKENA
jgi:hypothetical protein